MNSSIMCSRYGSRCSVGAYVGCSNTYARCPFCLKQCYRAIGPYTGIRAFAMNKTVSSFSRSHVRSYLVHLYFIDILLYSNATWIPTSLDLIVSGSRSEVVEGLHRTSGRTRRTGRAHMGPGTAHGLFNSKIGPPLGTTLQQSAGYPLRWSRETRVDEGRL